MKRQTKHSAAGDAIPIKGIEMIANHPIVLFRRVAFANEDPDIVDAQLVGHNDHATTFHPQRHRLLVSTPVANILEALRREVIRSIKGLSQTRAEPALWRLACRRGNDLLDFPNNVSL